MFKRAIQQLPDPRGFRSCLIWAGSMFLIVVVALFIGLLAFGITHRLTMFSKVPVDGSKPQLAGSQGTPQANEISGVTTSRVGIPEVEPNLVPWDGVGRVTILLLGLDYRDWESQNEHSRSDTMILLTLDPLSRTAGILSVPRDLWVAIPGFKHGKINTAYYLGDAYNLPGGGPGLAVKTVEQFLGVPINYYAQIDFGAFVSFIDEIGGVKIDVPEAITIDLLGSGSATKKTLQPGVQVLPGEWALAYARARYTQGGDFDRARRQQQVIFGIRDRILSADMLPTLISKAGLLYQQLSAGIHTNLSLDAATQLAVLASQIPKENIRQGVIDNSTVLFGESPDNLSILIPLIDKIHLLRDEIFSTSGALGPLAPGNAIEQMVAEEARVSVRNGTSQPDLAQRSADYLRSQGVNVVEVSESAQGVSLTVVEDYAGKPHTLRYLVDLMGINPNGIKAYDDSDNSVDIVLVLGNDWLNSFSTAP